MVPTVGIAFVVIFWTIVYIVDRILSSKRYVTQYRKVLERTGMTISFLQIRSYTKYFNRWFQQIGKMQGYLMQIWFNCGVVFGGFAMMFSVYALVTMLYKNMTEEKPEQMLTPVIPGVNIPWRHVIYYFVTLAVGGTLHEMGHAIAAARENVRVLGFGWFILPIFCGAYVELQTDHLQVISSIRQLRIYCAGVWHNCVSALIAAGLWLLLPYLYVLFYSIESGAVVSDVYRDSGVFDTLRRGDSIVSINNCTVRNRSDFYTCVDLAARQANQGYCHSLNAVVRRNTSTQYLRWDANEPDCCEKDSPSKFCFSHETDSMTTHSCLPARAFAVNDAPCYSNSDCNNRKASLCVIPLTNERNRFLRISRLQGQDVLFVGNPYELLSYVSVSDYFPKFAFVPFDVPDYIQTLFVYFASLSGALAILNMIPCYCLDGQWTLLAFIEYFLQKIVKSSAVRATIYHLTLLIGTSLLLVNFLYGMWNLRGQGILSVISQRTNKR